MSNFNGMPYKRSGRWGGKGVSMVGMLVFLLTALLVLSSCTDTETKTLPGETKYVCSDKDKTQVDDPDDCPDPVDPEPPMAMCDEGTEGNDTLSGSDFDDHICGLAGNDTISGLGGDDMLNGDAGNDTLDGGAGDDILKGGDGDDTLSSGTGNDKLYGGPGNDELKVQGGNNMLDGGAGEKDIVIYLETGGVNANLAKGTARHLPTAGSTDPFATPGGGNDELVNIENVKGSHQIDILTGDARNNLLKGLDSADTIHGGDGNDMIIPNRPMPPADAAEVVNDRADKVDGGDDIDTISYEGEPAGNTVTINLDTSNTTEPGFVAAVAANPAANPPVVAVPAFVQARVNDGTGDIDDEIAVVDIGTEDDPKLFTTIENIIGGAGGDNLTGDSRDNNLMGGAGNDTLNGGGGDDVLTGGAGDDTYDGGAGNDMIHADNEDSSSNIDGGDTPDNPDTTGVMEDMPPSEQDTVSFAAVTDTDLDTAGFQGVTRSLVDMTEVENLTGSNGIDSLTGDDNANVIMGLGGNDTIVAGAGADTLNGGAGRDTLTGGGGDDVIVVSSGQGPDTIVDWAINNPSNVNVNGDKLRLEGFASSSTASVEITSAVNVAVSVGDVVVLNVTAGTTQDVNTPQVLKSDLEATGKIVFGSAN